MKTSPFLALLRAHASLPLVFRSGSDIASPGYHLTEVKRVGYETMDCGAMTHRWSETHFEIWAPAAEQRASGRGHMPAEKFLRIIDRVEAELPLDGEAAARVHARFRDQPAALYDIESAAARDGELVIELSPDRTRCKAAERRAGAEAEACCGGTAGRTEARETTAACGCGGGNPAPAAAACCA